MPFYSDTTAEAISVARSVERRAGRPTVDLGVIFEPGKEVLIKSNKVGIPTRRGVVVRYEGENVYRVRVVLAHTEKSKSFHVSRLMKG